MKGFNNHQGAIKQISKELGLKEEHHGMLSNSIETMPTMTRHDIDGARLIGAIPRWITISAVKDIAIGEKRIKVRCHKIGTDV